MWGSWQVRCGVGVARRHLEFHQFGWLKSRRNYIHLRGPARPLPAPCHLPSGAVAHCLERGAELCPLITTHTYDYQRKMKKERAWALAAVYECVGHWMTWQVYIAAKKVWNPLVVFSQTPQRRCLVGSNGGLASGFSGLLWALLWGGACWGSSGSPAPVFFQLELGGSKCLWVTVLLKQLLQG